MSTFGKKGVTKRGVDPRDYAAVYAEGDKAQYLTGEHLIKEPFSIKLEAVGQKIDPTSRLDFSRIYTVEHNIKVFKVGRISSTSLNLLKTYFVESITGRGSGVEGAQGSSDEQWTVLEFPSKRRDSVEPPDSNTTIATELTATGSINMQQASTPHVTTSYDPPHHVHNAYSSRNIHSPPHTTSNAAAAEYSEITPFPHSQSSYPYQPDPSTTSRHISRTTGQVEPLDPSYQVRKHDYKKFFRVGRVFATLWPDSFSTRNSSQETFTSIISYGDKVHVKIRRFVVVREEGRSCTCLPITSYNGRGFKKRGIHLNEHGFIYSHNLPKAVPGMEKKPLKLNLSRGANKLSEKAMINYGRVYTVETNVKVKDVGELDRYSRELLTHYFKQVFLPGEDEPGPETGSEMLAGVGGATAYRGPSYSNMIHPSTQTAADYSSRDFSHSHPPQSQNTYASHDAAPTSSAHGQESYSSNIEPGRDQSPFGGYAATAFAPRAYASAYTTSYDASKTHPVAATTDNISILW